MNLSNTSPKFSIASPTGLNISLSFFIPFNDNKPPNTPSIEPKSIEPNILPRPEPMLLITFPIVSNAVPIPSPIVDTKLVIVLKSKSEKKFFTLSAVLPTNSPTLSNVFPIPLDTVSNNLHLSIPSPIDVINLPIPEPADKNIEPRPLNSPLENTLPIPCTTFKAPEPIVFITVNTPLKISLSCDAALPLSLKFSVNF